jgi:hypothetical protein
MLCIPTFAQAENQSDQPDWPVFARELWKATEVRCPLAARAYSEVFNPEVVLMDALELDFGNLAFIPAMGIVALNEVEKQFLATVTIGSNGVVDQLVYQNFFDEDQTGTDQNGKSDILGAKERAAASLSLMECMWPTESDLAALTETLDVFGSAAREMMSGTCEIQFFALYQRFVDVPDETIPADELPQRGKQILEEHNEYLDAYFETNDCEEFT